MQIKAETINEYLLQLTPERKDAINKLRDAIAGNLPEGFTETIGYGMITYVVPHSLYPPGYHTNPKMPLPFMALASQKNFIAVYHMGIYVDENLMNWFKEGYSASCKSKLDIGKSCIRFKKINEIPYLLIGQLSRKISAENWIRVYESQIRK